MSVLRSDRGPAEPQFVLTAMELYTSVLEHYHKFPKRHTFSVAQALLTKAGEILDNAVEGNSFPVTNQHEAQMRRDFFLLALTKTRSFCNRVEAITEAQNIQLIDVKVMENWMRLAHWEIGLLKGVMKSDRARFKTLP